MESISYKSKKNSLISSNDSLSDHPTKFVPTKKCKECNKKRKIFNKIDQICHQCYKAKTIVLSGNEVIDNFIKYTLTNTCSKDGRMEFVPFDRFENIIFIAEGGFSKIYKATWIDGPITEWNDGQQNYKRQGKMTVALKELNNSENIKSNELNELKMFYNFALNFKDDLKSRLRYSRRSNFYHSHFDFYHSINMYYGITQDPITKNFMIITKYYEKGSLSNFINKDFFSISWYNKLKCMHCIVQGLKNIHETNIIHKDYHSGNIFVTAKIGFSYKMSAITGDLGISKSSLDDDDNNEIYGIIPYVAPEVLQGQKYTKASDIYSLGMIMWELMTGRKPFWDKIHDTNLIIEICDGLRPPIVTNAPEGYIELMQECWHSDPNKRPTASDIFKQLDEGGILFYNSEFIKLPEIIKSSDIGPITANNPGATYKSRPLSEMIKSAETTRSLKIQSKDKRKFDNDLNCDNDKSTKIIKLIRNDDDYLTKELEFDI